MTFEMTLMKYRALLFILRCDETRRWITQTTGNGKYYRDMDDEVYDDHRTQKFNYCRQRKWGTSKMKF